LSSYVKEVNGFWVSFVYPQVPLFIQAIKQFDSMKEELSPGFWPIIGGVIHIMQW
jgi:hypothetical protein